MIDTKKILDAATKRYQDIITAVNKADTEELKALCLTSLFDSKDALYSTFVKDTYNQVLAVKSFYKDKCKSHKWFKPFLVGFKDYLDVGAGFKEYLDTGETIDDTVIMRKVYINLRNMFIAWYNDEPTCIFTDSAFQIYKLLRSIKYVVIWRTFIAPLTEYMENNSCTIEAPTNKDALKYFINTLCKDL